MKDDHFDIIIKKLSKFLSEKVKEFSYEKDEKYQLISLVDDLIVVWCKESNCLFSQILQASNIAERDSESCQNNDVQMIALSKPPTWDVKSISLNKNGTGILLIGNEGVGVVELPKRWGTPPLFEGGLDVFTCRVEYVGEQFFMCNPLIQIISADWHPGSMDHTFIIILSSDNYLRVYNLLYLDIPEQAIVVAKSANFKGETSKFGVGENAVAFGVGPPIYTTETNTTELSVPNPKDDLVEELNKKKQQYQDLLWPVFILHNNGDIYYTVTSLNKRSLNRRVLYGPLSFLPSSFDNYGVDFCSLLVLPCSPIVVIIANTQGYLHHCIVMETSGSSDKKIDPQQIEDLSLSVSQLNLESSNVYLHVYESIHLDLSYSTTESTFTSPLSLISDPNTPSRYWVSHNEGFHGVSIPLVERLLAEDIEFPEKDLECYVEHLLCTRPVTSSNLSPVIGLCVSSSGNIIYLLCSGLIQAISLPSSFAPKVPLFSLEALQDDDSTQKRKVQVESFEDRIRNTLLRESSQPLFTMGSLSESSPEEHLQLMCKVCNTLRENYIKPQIKAREEIRRRHKMLIDQKEHLKRELNVLEKEKVVLTDKAHELAEKYEEANDRHLEIIKRLELVIGNLVRKIPFLASSERHMLSELQDILEKSKNLKTQLSQIQSKYEWQTNQVEKQKMNEHLKNKKTSTLSDNQLTCLKMSLGKESERLTALVNKINQIKKVIGV